MDAGKDNIDLAREKKHVKRLQKSLPKDASVETFLDVHGSLSRHEICHMSTTCVRPNSKIVWMQKNRYVKPDEFLNLQGLWPEDRPELANLAREFPVFTVRAAGEAKDARSDAPQQRLQETLLRYCATGLGIAVARCTVLPAPACRVATSFIRCPSATAERW